MQNNNMLKFIVNEPALMIGKTLVIADLHIGLEYELLAAGFNVPDQAQTMLKKIKRLLRENKCKELIIIGDVKHTIARLSWPEQEEISEFFRPLEKITKVHIVKGNHDGNIERYVSNVHPTEGFEYKGYWIMHGHARPPKEAAGKTIILGHMHPVVEFRDSLGGRLSERVWIRTNKSIVVPAFNDLLGGIDVRKGLLGPMKKHIDPKRAELYLLDGLHLGKISQLKGRK
jgi:hypothetical protein